VAQDDLFNHRRPTSLGVRAVTKGAGYHHFSDKQRLFEAVMNQYNEAAEQKVYEAIAKHPDDVWAAATAGPEATLDVCADPSPDG
jgi:AcrR family transcriptional regulator